MRKIDLGLFAIFTCAACAARAVSGCGPLANDPVPNDGGGGGGGSGNSDATTPPPAGDSGSQGGSHDAGATGGDGGGSSGEGGGGSPEGGGSDDAGEDSASPSDDSGPPLVCTQAGTTWTSGKGISNAGWTATAIATPATDGTLSDAVTANAFDNNLTTRWSTGQAQTPAAGEYYLLDLGSPQTISQVALYYPPAGDAGTTDFPAGYSLGLSTSASGPFTTVATGVGGSPTAMCFPAQSAQYLKITQTGTSGSWLSIYEIQVF
jgi:hypothetical protein